MNTLCDWFFDADLIVERQQRLLREATCLGCLSAHDGQAYLSPRHTAHGGAFRGSFRKITTSRAPGTALSPETPGRVHGRERSSSSAVGDGPLVDLAGSGSRNPMEKGRSCNPGERDSIVMGK
jgi:hypothetical protein